MTMTSASWAWIATGVRQHYDDDMAAQYTEYQDDWDGRYTALCPHGGEASWVSRPRRTSYPLCTCGRP